MKQALLLIVSLISLSACGKSYQDAEFVELVNEFETVMHTDASRINLVFVDNFNDDSKLAECISIPLMPRTIYVRKQIWEWSTHDSRKILLFHELGHCVFNRGHKEDTYPDGCHKSIMASKLVDQTCYDTHYDELMSELRQ